LLRQRRQPARHPAVAWAVKSARPTFVQVYSEPLGKTSPNSHSQASKFFGEAR
jgi:hypothetical protein